MKKLLICYGSIMATKLTPWQQCPHIWKSEAQFWTFIRGVLRKGWSKFPLKLEYIKTHRKRIVNPIEKNRTRFPECWGMTCDICSKDTVQAEIEIDHKGDGSSFRGLQDVEKYVEHLFLIDYNSIRPVCKSCHKIENQRQRKGISFEDAQLDKEVIFIMKNEKLEDILAFISDYDYNGIYQVNNASNRRKAVESILRNVT